MNEVFNDLGKLFKSWIEGLKEKAPHDGYKWKIAIDSYQYEFEAFRHRVSIQAIETSKSKSTTNYISEEIRYAPKYFMRNLKRLMVETEKIFASYKMPPHSVKARELIDRIGPIKHSEIWEFETDAGVIAFKNNLEPIFEVYDDTNPFKRRDSYDLGRIDGLHQDGFLVKHLDAMLEYAKQPRKQTIQPHLVDMAIKHISDHFIQGGKECEEAEISGAVVRFYGNGLSVGRETFNIGKPYSMGRTARSDRFLIENEEQIITYIKECRARKSGRMGKDPNKSKLINAKALIKTFVEMLTSTIGTMNKTEVQIVHEGVKYTFSRHYDKYTAPFKVGKISISWPYKGEWDTESVKAFIDKWPVISQLFKEEIERIVGEAKAEEDDLANTLKSDFMTELMLMKMGGTE